MRTILITAVACTLTAATAFGQRGPVTATMPPGNAMALTTLNRTVSDLDKAVSFYHEVVGLEIERQEKTPVADTDFQRLAGLPSAAKVRRAVLLFPAGNPVKLELVEVTGVPRTPVAPRTQDAGNVNIVFRVRDVKTATAQAKKLGAKPLTFGGEPMERGANLSVFMQDPDGLSYQMETPMAGLPAEPAGKVVNAGLVQGGTYDKKVEFYKAIGVEVRKGNPMPWDEGREKVLAPGMKSSINNNTVLIPGSDVRWTIIDFPEGGDRKLQFTGNVQDPGTSMFTIRVHDAAAAAQAVKTAGGSVVSMGGTAVKLAKGAGVIVRDPEGVVLQLIQE